MMVNKIAVIIPYYKIDFFEETLISLKNQTDKRFNLYIGNDNSPDDPQNLIKRYDSFITRYKKFETNVGKNSLSKQWERCIDEFIEKEKWVHVLADDDTISENFIEEFYNNVKDAEINNISLIKYKCKIINEHNEIQKKFPDYPRIQKAAVFFGNLYNNIGFSTLSENIFRIDKYRKYRYQDIELAYGSDAIAVLEFSEFGDILFINNAFMSFRDSEVNLSGYRNSTDYRGKKMIGNTQYMTYLLKNYRQKFEYETKVNMCKMLYRNFRVVYKNNLFKNIYYFSILLRSIKTTDIKNIIKNGGN
jgi:hypothetical protein